MPRRPSVSWASHKYEWRGGSRMSLVRTFCPYFVSCRTLGSIAAFTPPTPIISHYWQPKPFPVLTPLPFTTRFPLHDHPIMEPPKN
jgi:hypothetical protein